MTIMVAKEDGMSRTYRTHLEYESKAYGRYWTWEEEKAFVEEMGWSWREPRGWTGHYFLNRKSRDKKPWDKPPRWLKTMNRRIERVKEEAAVRLGKEIPLFRKGDRYDWT